jgi:hypothetical protein
VLEVADDAVDLDPGVLLGDLGRRLAQGLLRDVERDETAQASRLDHCLEQQPGLLRCPRPRLDERVRLRQPCDLGGAAGEDEPLAAGQVVLGEARDALEEGRAVPVVEPLRRQLLRHSREACQHVAAQRFEPLLRPQVDVDLEGGDPNAVAHPASLAQRKPAKS